VNREIYSHFHAATVRRRTNSAHAAALTHAPINWSAPTKLSQIIDLEPAQLESFAGLIPELEFLLDDISNSDNADLRRRTREAATALFLLRDGRSSKSLLDGLKQWAPELAQIAEAPGGLQALTALLEYALRVGEIPRHVLEQFFR